MCCVVITFIYKSLMSTIFYVRLPRETVSCVNDRNTEDE